MKKIDLHMHIMTTTVHVKKSVIRMHREFLIYK